MNTNMTLTCEICEQDTDCRIGYSNRRIQPLSFVCPHCGSLMYITLDISNAPSSDFKFRSCHKSKNQPQKIFNGTNPFVDLHLDFPVRFGEYVMGNTPFLMALRELEDLTDSEREVVFQKLAFHTERLNQLNHFHDKADKIKAIIRLYNGNNKQLFKKRVGKFLQQDQGASLKPKDINASLYLFLSFVFLPFVKFGEVTSLVKESTQLITNLPTKPLNDFVENLVSSNFLSTLQNKRIA